MTKAKVILSGIAFFAIIGGAVAFKSRNAGSLYYPTAFSGTIPLCYAAPNFSTFALNVGPSTIAYTSTVAIGTLRACDVNASTTTYGTVVAE